MKTKAITLALASLAALSQPLSAYTLFWGGPVWGEHLESDGTTMLQSGTFTFQIGAFSPGFDPNATYVDDFGNAQVDTWAANWHVFDTATYSDTNMFFDSKADMDANGISNGTLADTSFDFRNAKLYIWVYDDNTYDVPLSSTECHEWALISGATWTLPADGGDQTTLPGEYRLDNATEAVIGAVDPTGTGGGAIVGTLGTLTTPSGAYDLQTATICVVPEPSTSALLALLGSAALLRRKRG